MKRQYRVSSLEKALDLLDAFSGSDERLSGSELAERLNTSASTIYPTLKTLEKYGYLRRDDQKRYRLGLKFLEKSRIILTQLDVREVAKPHLKRLAATCEANAHLAILNEWRVMYLHREEGYPSVTLTDIVGRTVPVHCTALGKVLLAAVDRDRLDEFFASQELVALTPNTITARPHLEDELERIRQRGYAIDTEEFHEGVVCVAAPVCDYRGTVVSAISISLPRSRLSDSGKMDHCIEQVTQAARRISEEQGYQSTPS